MTQETILVVEDEAIVALELRTRLQELGYRVPETCSTGHQALAMVEQHHPDLVLMDIMLKEEPDGIDTGQVIRNNYQIPLIFLTAYADDETLERAKFAEPSGYLIKPFEERQLRSTIEMALYKYRLERDLHKTEQWLSTVLDSIGDGVIAIDARERITLINPMAETLTGWSENEALGKPVSQVFKIINEVTHEEMIDPAVRALKSGEPINRMNHTLLLSKTGQKIPIDDRAAPIRNEMGILIGAVLIFQDVTQKRAQMRELHIKDQAVESAMDGLAILDLSGKFTYANKAFLDMWGFLSENQVREFNFTDLWQPGQESSSLLEWVREDGFWMGELIARSRDNSKLDVQISANLVREENATPICMLISVADISERKKAVRALQESEARYRELANSLPETVFEIDRDGNITFVNEKSQEMFGYTLDDLTKETHFSEMLIPEDRSRALENFQARIKGKSLESNEYTALRKDGSTFPAEVYARPILHEDNIVGIRGILVDISERRATEQELINSEKKYRLLFENNLSGVFRSTLEGELLDCNSAYAEMFGYESRDEILQHSVLDLYPRIEIREEMLKALNDKKHLKNYELELLRKDGSTVWALINVNLVQDFNDDQEILVGNIADITEQKKAHEALQRSEKNYRSIFENIQSGVFQKLPDHEILNANHQLAEILGYDSPNEIIGQNFKAICGCKQAEMEHFEAILAKEGAVKNYEARWQTKSGKPIVVNVNAHEVRNDDGNLLFIEGMAEDISERYELERQLIQAQKMESLGQIAGGIAHDFNNVMATILGAVQFLDMKIQGEGLKKYVDMISSSIERGKTITDRMLTFTRSDRPDYQSISAMDFLYNIRTIANHSLTKNIQVEINPYQGSDRILADKGQLQHVLINMCINASHAMPEGGAITLGIRQPQPEELAEYDSDRVNQYLCLTVADTGTGIDAETQKRIFEPFFTTKAQGKGTGLGLSVAKKIIDSHKGWITVGSELGHGTTFTIGIPATDKKEHFASTDLHEVTDQGQGEHILMVDDEESIRHLLKEYLLKNGYRVTTAEDGVQALELFNSGQERFDLVITDLGLPEISGVDLAQQLLQRYPALPIIGNTGYLGLNERAVLVEKGFAAIVQKPFELKNVLGVITEVLHGEAGE